eukprot:tig00021612_g22901.t1
MELRNMGPTKAGGTAASARPPTQASTCRTSPYTACSAACTFTSSVISPNEVGGERPSASSARRGQGLRPMSTFTLPSWAGDPRVGHAPQSTRLEVLKNDQVVETIPLHKTAYVIGRPAPGNHIHIPAEHASISRLHAAVVHHKNGNVYVLDLGSTHGTFVADVRIEAHTPTLLDEGTTLRLGASSRLYVLRGCVHRDFSVLIEASTESPEEATFVDFATRMNRKARPRPAPAPRPRPAAPADCGVTARARKVTAEEEDGRAEGERRAGKSKRAGRRVAFDEARNTVRLFEVGEAIEEAAGAGEGDGAHPSARAAGEALPLLASTIAGGTGAFAAIVRSAVLPAAKPQPRAAPAVASAARAARTQPLAGGGRPVPRVLLGKQPLAQAGAGGSGPGRPSLYAGLEPGSGSTQPPTSPASASASGTAGAREGDARGEKRAAEGAEPASAPAPWETQGPVKTPRTTPDPGPGGGRPLNSARAPAVSAGDPPGASWRSARPPK